MYKTNHAYFIFLIFYCLLFSPHNIWASKVKQGTVVFAPDFNHSAGQNIWRALPSLRWVTDSIAHTTCLFINGTGMTLTNIDLTPYSGMKLLFRCKVKAENVTRPPFSYLGIKYMLHYKTKTKELFKNENNIYGTFNWKELTFTTIIPEDASLGQVYLGLQSSTGKVWFDSVNVKVVGIPTPSIKPKHIFHAITKFRGTMSPNALNERDIKTLGKDWNANLIRWQLSMKSSERFWLESDLTRYNQWIEKKLHELDSALIICQKYGIKVVIDLHSFPGNFRKGDSSSQLFYDRNYNDYFVQLWQQIALRYKKNSNVWGYDLINEPVQRQNSPSEMNYFQTELKAAKAIRCIDKNTPIIFEVPEGDSPDEFTFLKPIPISNVIYEVHLYLPIEYTLQGVYNNTSGIAYPGKIKDTYYDKARMKEILQPVRKFQLAYKVPIYVGEFSAIRWAPGAAQYLDDCISIFEEYGWNWTYHAFREWNGWDVEYENGTSKRDKATRATQDTDRKKVLLKWFKKNKK